MMRTDWQIKCTTSLLVILSSTVSFAADLPFTLSKDTTAIIEPVKPDGTVDYVAGINLIYAKAIKPDQNGYVTWLTATGTDVLPNSIRSKTLEAIGVAPNELPEKGFNGKDAPGEYPQQPWTSAQHAEVAKFLDDNGKFLDIAVVASQKPSWCDPAVSPDGSLNQVLLPSLQWLRNISRALCSRALLRAGTGDFDGFMSDVMAAKRLARLSEGWTFISRLVSAGIDGMANKAIAAVVANGSLTAEQGGRLAAALDQLSVIPSISNETNVSERWFVLDFAARVAIGKAKKGEIDARFLEQVRSAAPGDIDWNVVLRRLNQRADQMVAILNDPKMVDLAALNLAMKKLTAEVQSAETGRFRNAGKAPAESTQEYSNRLADRLLLNVAPNLARPVTMMRDIQMRDEIVGALVAAGRFHAEKLSWPAKLDDLVPKYLASVPRDIYSPAAADPVRYTQSDAGIFIYSAGPNRVDDNGTKDDVGEGIVPTTGDQGL